MKKVPFADYSADKGLSIGYGVQCPKCGKVRELADINLVGKVYCPNCGERLDNKPEMLVEIENRSNDNMEVV